MLKKTLAKDALVMLLSGTPLMNRPDELIPQLILLGRMAEFGGERMFKQRYCYQDADGKPCNPIEAQSVFVDDENRRYGMVEDMIGPQDEINVYRRKAAHRATFRQLQETDPQSAGIDPDEARRRLATIGTELIPPDGLEDEHAVVARVNVGVAPVIASVVSTTPAPRSANSNANERGFAYTTPVAVSATPFKL